MTKYKNNVRISKENVRKKYNKNILDIFDELSEAMYHVERNGNPKIIFTDLSIKLTRLIHRK